MSGAGKTMAAIILLARAIAQGAGGFIIDRAGHFEFLASLLPGASVGADRRRGARDQLLGRRGPGAASPRRRSTTCWRCTRCCSASTTAGRDSYGLTDLESNLLGLAIGEVYERCALTGEEPRELLLQEELERRYHAERARGLGRDRRGAAEPLDAPEQLPARGALRLPHRPPDDDPAPTAPLVVFDTRLIPEAKARRRAVRDLRARQEPDRSGTRREHLAGRRARRTRGRGAASW